MVRVLAVYFDDSSSTTSKNIIKKQKRVHLKRSSQNKFELNNCWTQ